MKLTEDQKAIALEKAQNHGLVGNPEMMLDFIHDFLSALAEKQEPICWMTPSGEGWMMRTEPPVTDTKLGWTPLYAAPAVSPDVEMLNAENHSLKTENANLLAANRDCLDHFNAIKEDYEKLETELGAARKDAEKLKLLGEMRDGAVIWFSTNPHGWPDGTRYYAAIEQAKGAVCDE